MLALGGLEPVEIVGDFDNAALGAAVGFFRAGIVVEDLVAFGFAVIEGFGVGEKGADFTVEGFVVGFEGEDVMGSGEMDFLRDLFLAAHGVEGDGGAFDIELAQELGHGGDFVGLAVD